MNTSYRLILCAAAVVVAAESAVADPPASGHVLILANERTVEGDIEHLGNQYRIHQGTGETWVAADKVLRLCADMPDAYRVLRGRTNVGDPDECLRLARWCHAHQLPAQALENVEMAVRLNPSQTEARRLLNSLQRAAASTPAPAAPAVVRAVTPLDMPELNTEARATFATKIEPILMNACAGCHATDRGGAFKLTRNYDRPSVNSFIVQQNLAAVLAQVNVQQPLESKLLVKAVTAHDPKARQAPLNGKQMAAYHSIEEWVQTTLASNPHLRERAGSPAKTVAVTTAEPKSVSPVSAPTVAAAAGHPPAADFAVSRPAPQPTAPVDEFDPILFNRQTQHDDPERR